MAGCEDPVTGDVVSPECTLSAGLLGGHELISEPQPHPPEAQGLCITPRGMRG